MTARAGDLFRRAVGQLAAAGIDLRDAAQDVRHLLAECLEVSPSRIHGDAALALSPEREARFAAWLERRRAREPVQRILGNWEFWTLELDLNADTLVPRPDSETLVRAVLADCPDRARPLRLLDLGTGSGCLLLALLAELPEAKGLGIDKAPGAIAAARHNAQRLGMGNRAEFRTADWLEGIADRFDAIVSNPPYIPTAEIDDLAPEVSRFEPRLALDGGPDGLAPYRHLAPRIGDHLLPGGRVYFEVGQGQARPVADLLRDAFFVNIQTERDLGGIERLVRAEKD
ncbi:MAG: peptide chain release factor N(5)-glutamine methyltransferase [Rhodospirillales bacterium]|nr:peptide chain release factor N(5)-glutamine methyltransferase [Rhodospirillales bacterium]